MASLAAKMNELTYFHYRFSIDLTCFCRWRRVFPLVAHDRAPAANIASCCCSDFGDQQNLQFVAINVPFDADADEASQCLRRDSV